MPRNAMKTDCVHQLVGEVFCRRYRVAPTMRGVRHVASENRNCSMTPTHTRRAHTTVMPQVLASHDPDVLTLVMRERFDSYPYATVKCSFEAGFRETFGQATPK